MVVYLCMLMLLMTGSLHIFLLNFPSMILNALCNRITMFQIATFSTTFVLYSICFRDSLFNDLCMMKTGFFKFQI